MSKQDNLDKIIEIIKKGALKFRDDFDKNSENYFIEEKKENEIVIRFNMKYDIVLKYLIIFTKLKTNTDYIPNVKGNDKLDLNSNPYRELKFTDENVILGNIYEYLKEINFDEIACYQKFGIILRNPLELKGIYNITIKYIGD